MAVFYGEAVQLLRSEYGGYCIFNVVFFANEGSAVSTHDAGDIRPYDIFSHDALHAPQHGVIEESTALDDDLLAGFLRIPEFYYLIQRVLYYRI